MVQFLALMYGLQGVVDEQLGSLQMKTIRISNNGETELNSAQISKHFKFLSKFPPDISLQQILRDAKVLAEGFRFCEGGLLLCQQYSLFTES